MNFAKNKTHTLRKLWLSINVRQRKIEPKYNLIIINDIPCIPLSVICHLNKLWQ